MGLSASRTIGPPDRKTTSGETFEPRNPNQYRKISHVRHPPPFSSSSTPTEQHSDRPLPSHTAPETEGMPGPTLFPPPPEITGIPTKAELDAYPRLNTWEQLKDIIARCELGELGRGKALQARYDKWTAGIRERYGTTEKYLIQARLPWKVPSPAPAKLNGEANPNGVIHSANRTQENGNTKDEQYLTFEIGQTVDPDVYAILPNDWPYNTPGDVEHVVVWSKLPVFHAALVGNDTEKWEKVEQDGFAGFTGNPETQPPPATPSAKGQVFSSLADRGTWGWCTEGGREVGKMVTTLWPIEEYECAWVLIGTNDRSLDTTQFVNPPQESIVTQPTPTATRPAQQDASRTPLGVSTTQEAEEYAMISPPRDDQSDNVTDTPIKSHHDELPDDRMDASMAESSGAQVDGSAAADDKGSEEHKRREGEKKERERKNIAKKPREQNCIARRLPERCIPPPGHPLYRDPNVPQQSIPGPSNFTSNHASAASMGASPYISFPSGNGHTDGSAEMQSGILAPVMPLHHGTAANGLQLPAPPSVQMPENGAGRAHHRDFSDTRMSIPNTASASFSRYSLGGMGGDMGSSNANPGYMMGSLSDHDVQYAMGSKRRKVGGHRDSTSIPDSTGNHHHHQSHYRHNSHRPMSASVPVKTDSSRSSTMVDTKFPLTVPLSAGEMPHRLQGQGSLHQLAVLPGPVPTSVIATTKTSGTSSAGPKHTSGSTTLAETTARLARLERLLTLQDHTYAEKRLRLAEEAALRMLEGGSGAGEENGASPDQQGVSRELGLVEGNAQTHTGPNGSTSLRIDTQHTAGSSRTVPATVPGEHEEDLADGHPESAEIKGRFGRWDAVEIIGDAGYTGAEGLNALTAASVLVGAKQPARPGSGKTFFARKSPESTNHSSMENLIGLSQVQAIEIRSLISVLPTVEIAQHLIERYFNLWDWSRYPVLPSNVFPQDWRKFYTSEIVTEMGMPGTNHFSAFALLLGTLALGAVSPVLSSSDTHVTASTYFWAASKALMYCETAGTNELRTIWAKSVLVRYTDLVRNTQASWHVVGGWIRNAIDQGLHRDGTGFEPPLPPDLTAERRVLWSHVLHAAMLPACLSLDPTKFNHALEQKYPRLPFYRQLINGAMFFHRILLHRPFMLKPIRKRRHPYRYSWQKCVETAVQDLRARSVWERTLSPSEQTQTYGGSFAPFNSCVVLGLSTLISLDMGEMPSPEVYSEHLTYLQNFVQRLQSDLDNGRDGTTAQKERTIMDSILARLDALINNDDNGNITKNVRGGSAGSSGTQATGYHAPSSSIRQLLIPSPATSGHSTPFEQPNPHNPNQHQQQQQQQQMSSIDFDPFLLQALVQNPSTTFDPNVIIDSQAPFDWEVYLSEMYNEGNLFMN
ncbi:hypothetical protein QFC22_002137 [Naganishia vaughanmartiniae]|uniref:Uncharacterized protein n=1 Tax=Naganishia vaughanmartiniae TaxID=1424756 RepID=A0ACC2XDL3_9TREE|nr:hypothetical protein QFC22_002137 [Naganishia vaughanmartiniae]